MRLRSLAIAPLKQRATHRAAIRDLDRPKSAQVKDFSDPRKEPHGHKRVPHALQLLVGDLGREQQVQGSGEDQQDQNEVQGHAKSGV